MLVDLLWYIFIFNSPVYIFFELKFFDDQVKTRVKKYKNKCSWKIAAIAYIFIFYFALAEREKRVNLNVVLLFNIQHTIWDLPAELYVWINFLSLLFSFTICSFVVGCCCWSRKHWTTNDDDDDDDQRFWP
jgi:hypothetical protein